MLTLRKAPFVPLAVASVMESPEVELILVCPNESDPSFALFPGLVKAYGDRIQIVSKPDTSPAEGINNGLAVVRGDIIAVLNGDDFYLPGALNFVNTTFRMNPQIDILLGGGLIVDHDTNLVKQVIPGNITLANRFKDYPGAFTFLHQSMFYRTKKFKTFVFNEKNQTNWDTEFLLSMLELKPQIEITNRSLAVFRLSKANLSSEIQSSKNRTTFYSNKPLRFSPKEIFLQIGAGILRLSKFIKLIKWIMLCQIKREPYRTR